MTGTLRVTTAGAYVEQDPLNAVYVTTVGVYAEQDPLNAVYVTTVGVYVELNPHQNLMAKGASTSAGAAAWHMRQALAASGASSSAGAAALKVASPDDVAVTQAGAEIDTSSVLPVAVTQIGAEIDVRRTVPVAVTQVGAEIDVQRTVPVDMTQVGAQIDAEQIVPVDMTQVGAQIDARYQRPETALNCWEFHVEDIVGQHLAYLDGAKNKAYLEALSDCGSGMFTIAVHDPKATSTVLAYGNIVKVRYRNVDIGAWVIENIHEVLVGSGESAVQAYQVSGRGLLGLLDRGIVYPASLVDAETAERKYAAVTKASILLGLYGEFVLRGGGDLLPDFTSAYDSSRQAFSDSVTLNFRAGQTLLDVARNLAGLGLELTTDPDKTLRAWNTAGTDRSAAVFFRQGQNVLDSQKTTEGTGLTNAVLGEGQGVFVESADLTSIATYRRKESYLQVKNTADSGQVAVANSLLLTGWKDPRAAHTVEALAAPFYPFFDYHIGDIVAISIPDKLEGDYRILGIAVKEENGPCDLRVTLEINDLATEYLQRLQLAFDTSLMSVKPGPGATSGLANSGTQSALTSTTTVDTTVIGSIVDPVLFPAAYNVGSPTVDGSWRIVQSGNDLVFQRRESSVWVTKETVAA